MSEYTEFLQEVFEQFGPVTVRKMFGGVGLFFNGLMFGLVSDDKIYLKVDAENTRFFEERGLGPFEYSRRGKTVKMSFFLAPEEILDDREEAALWAERSYRAALRRAGVAES
jgi:DNA transformation protein